MSDPAPTFQVPAGQRQLFVDGHGVAHIDGLTRTMHRPAKRGAVIRPDLALGIDSIQTRSAPIWDARAGVYRFWDLSMPAELHARKVRCGGYHESSDGLHWRQPALGQIEYRGSRENHFTSVLIGGEHHAIATVASADPAEGFKGLVYGKAEMLPVASADGRHWARLDAPPIPSADEFNLSYDAAERRYLGTVKIQEPPRGRQVALYTSRDFIHWENHGLIFHADEEDQRHGRANIESHLANPALLRPRYHKADDYFVDVYNMGVFRYEGLYLGMPAMYHATGWIPNYPNTDGFHHVQLVTSRDLRGWSRVGDRQPFIAPSPLGAGAYDLLQIMPPSAPIVRGDELWFYYTGLKYRASFDYEGQYPNGTHIPQQGLDPDQSAICLAVLRRDGFVSLDAGERPGSVTTEPFVLEGGKIHVNADARGGELTLEILSMDGEPLARSVPITEDVPASALLWRSGGMEGAHRRAVRLRFALQNARLYSYWVGS